MASVTYLEHARVMGLRVDAETPRNPYANGYGSRIPTRYMLKLGKRWHRVYVVQWSNAGSAYVLERGARLFLSIETQSALEDAR